MTQPEVKTFCAKGHIGEITQFESRSFAYNVEQDDIDQLVAIFESDTITLKVPKEFAEHWDGNDVVGLEQEQQLSNGSILSLLLEKDFACLDKTNEDQSENYPNPKADHC